ncbi:helix-turn-helix transcriptional regulator [Nocardiopsis rhodophaea]|uniref:Helix-turn-helix transcriptional regulator n=1 Tax=Nocardiopsis rhodophaea TaxID=280238 RepID=A0ABP5EM51_9ACTN
MALREQSYLVLLALAEGEQLHGYGIITAVRRLSDDRVKLGAGTLYGALDRLATEGLVEVSGQEVVRGRNRRYYRLTEDGRRVLSAETDRLAKLTDVARQLLGRGTGPRPAAGTV